MLKPAWRVQGACPSTLLSSLVSYSIEVTNLDEVIKRGHRNILVIITEQTTLYLPHILSGEIKMHEGAAQSVNRIRKSCHYKISSSTMSQERWTCISHANLEVLWRC